MGSKIKPETISLCDLRAIEIQKWGIPCKKFVVPSIGSIIHKLLLSLLVMTPSSSEII